MGIIFVGGIHAVGKSTVCASTSASLGLPHYSAGEIIKVEKIDAIYSGSKAVSDIDGNQTLLIRGIQKLEAIHAGSIIVDGHFTLLNSDGEVKPVSVDVFRLLRLEGIVVLHDDPKGIAQRLADRDSVAPNPDFIDKHQNLELEQAKRVAAELGVSINFLKAFDQASFSRLLSEYVNKQEGLC